MKHKALKMKTLPSHPFPVSLAHSTHKRQIRKLLTTLEAHLISSNQSRLLLLLEKVLMEDLSLIALERFLRYASCQRVLLLVSPKSKAPLIARWEHTTSWKDGRKLASQFSMTSTPQNTLETQVCITTVFDIQVHIGVDSQQPFFQAFDVIILYDVPANPGPAWNQIMEIFVARDTPIIGLSSLLSEEEGKLLFECVIDTKRTSS